MKNLLANIYGYITSKRFISIALIISILATNIITALPSLDCYFVGTYICWILAGIFTVINSTKNERAFAFSFLFIMVGNLIDSKLFSYDTLGWNEYAYLVIIPIIFYCVWRFGGRHRADITQWSMLLIVMSIYSTLTRNKVFVPYMYLGDANDMFFKGDAILWAMFGIYAVRHTHGVNRIITGGVLALIMSNLADELVLSPLKITKSEFTTAIYVAVMTIMFSLWYKFRKNNRLQRIVNFSIIGAHLLIIVYFLIRYAAVIKAAYA